MPLITLSVEITVRDKASGRAAQHLVTLPADTNAGFTPTALQLTKLGAIVNRLAQIVDANEQNL